MELQNTRHLRHQLEAADFEPESILLAIQSETNLEEAIQEVVEEIEELESLSKAAKARSDAIKQRSERMSAKVSTLKTVVMQAMEIAHINMILGPSCTISTKKMPKKLVITEESLIPAEYFKPQDPKLDRKALLAAVKDGPVEGACLSNGGLTIQIRRD